MGLRRKQEVIRLTFGEDWIDVRSGRKYGDTIRAQRAAASKMQAVSTGRKGAAEAAATLDFDLAAFNLSLLTTMIVAWSDEDVPIDEDTVQELPNDTIQEVLDVILGSRTEEEKAPLETISSSSSEQPEVNGQLEEETPPGHES